MDKKSKTDHAYDKLDEINRVASVTECTGLIQIPPANIEESESYSDIYNVPIQINHIKDVGDKTADNTRKKEKAAIG